MDKSLYLHTGLTDCGDLFSGKFPGDYYTGDAVLFCPVCALRRVNRHLGGCVNGNIWGHPADQPQNTQILYQERIHAHFHCRLQKLYQRGKL